MAKEKSNLIDSPWTIGIVTTVLPSLISLANDIIEKIPLLTTFFSAIDWFKERVFAAINYPVPFGWIVITMLSVIGIATAIIHLIKSSTIEPEFTKYKSDKFKSWQWCWQWKKIGNNWQVEYLKPYCPKCNTPLTYIVNFNIEIASCPRCQYKSDSKYNASYDFEYQSDVLVLIHDNLDRQEKERRKTKSQV